jgi:hypothetical protein
VVTPTPPVSQRSWSPRAYSAPPAGNRGIVVGARAGPVASYPLDRRPQSPDFAANCKLAAGGDFGREKAPAPAAISRAVQCVGSSSRTRRILCSHGHGGSGRASKRENKSRTRRPWAGLLGERRVRPGRSALAPLGFVEDDRLKAARYRAGPALLCAQEAGARLASRETVREVVGHFLTNRRER